MTDIIDQPKEESQEKTEQTQEVSEAQKRYDFLEKDEPPKEEKKEEKPDEKKEEKQLQFDGELTKEKAEELVKDLPDTEKIKHGDKEYANKAEFLSQFAPKEEIDFKYDKNEITVGKGEDKIKLVRVDLNDGSFVYAPDTHKGGVLMQADYTKKTQDLANDRKTFEAEKQKIEADKQYISNMQFIAELGKPPLKPILDAQAYDGEVLLDEKENVLGIAYNDRAKFLKADMEYNDWFTKNTQYQNTQKQVKDQNIKTLDDFAKEHGEDLAKQVVTEVSKYMNPYIFKELVPYPKEVLELVRKGMMYDADIKKLKDETESKVNSAVLAKVKELEKNSPKKDTPKSEETKTDTNWLPKRYEFLNQE